MNLTRHSASGLGSRGGLRTWNLRQPVTYDIHVSLDLDTNDEIGRQWSRWRIKQPLDEGPASNNELWSEIRNYLGSTHFTSDPTRERPGVTRPSPMVTPALSARLMTETTTTTTTTVAAARSESHQTPA